MSHAGASDLADRSGGFARHWSVVAGAACLMVAAQFAILGTSILNPPLAESLGIGLSQVMIYNSVMAVSGVLSMSVIAPAMFRRIGVRASVIGGGVWLAATIGAVAFVDGPLPLYALGFASGLTFGLATSMAASMLVNTWFVERRGTVMGAVFALSGLGGIGSGLVLPALVGSGGWRLGFAVTAGVIVVLVVLPGIVLIRSAPGELGLRPYGASAGQDEAGALAVDVPGVPARLGFRTPQFVGLSAAILLVGAIQAVSQHFAPVMVERGVDLTMAGSLISLMALVSVFTNILVGTLNDRLGTLAAVLVALGGQLLAMVGFLFASGFVPLAASITLYAFGVTFPGVLIPILVMQVFGLRDYAAILGVTMAMLPAGVSIGTPLWGVALDSTGSYDLALAVAAVLTGLSILLVWWVVSTAPALRRRVEGTPG